MTYTSRKVYAILMGKVARDNSMKISRSKVNQLLKGLGIDIIKSAETFKAEYQAINEDPDLATTFSQARHGQIGIEDIHANLPQTRALTDADIDSVVSPSVIAKTAERASQSLTRRLIKEVSTQELISQRIVEQLKDQFADYQAPKQPLPPLESGNSLVVVLSDWHIGATVNNVDGNTFNLAVAKRRIQQFLSETLQTISKQEPEHVYIFHAGDAIEGIDMRQVNQAFDAEIDATSQLAVATRLLVDFVASVSEFSYNVTVGCVGGNHDRYTSNKKAAVYNDNVMYNIVDTLLLLSEQGVFHEGVSVIDNRNDIYSLTETIQGKTVKLVHGDTIPATGSRLLMLSDQEYIDYGIHGHYHYFQTVQETGGRMMIASGSLQGHNTYVKQINKPRADANQLLLTFRPTGVEINPVILP